MYVSTVRACQAPLGAASRLGLCPRQLRDGGGGGASVLPATPQPTAAAASPRPRPRRSLAPPPCRAGGGTRSAPGTTPPSSTRPTRSWPTASTRSTGPSRWAPGPAAPGRRMPPRCRACIPTMPRRGVHAVAVVPLQQPRMAWRAQQRLPRPRRCSAHPARPSAAHPPPGLASLPSRTRQPTHQLINRCRCHTCLSSSAAATSASETRSRAPPSRGPTCRGRRSCALRAPLTQICTLLWQSPTR